MRIGRNKPCPCGSGKKYKKCCALKQPGDIAQSTANPFEPQVYSNDFKNDNDKTDEFEHDNDKTDGFEHDNDKTDGFEHDNDKTDEFEHDDDKWDKFEQNNDNWDDLFDTNTRELMIEFATKMRLFFLNKKAHIKEYKKIRRLHSEVLTKMMDCFYSGEFEQKIDTDYTSKYVAEHYAEKSKTTHATLILTELKFDESDIGARGLCDMIVYKPSPNINCLTEEFIEKHRYRKPEKKEFLQSMLDSKLGLFEITGTDLDEGYAFIRDIFNGTKYKITDIGISGGGNADIFYLYTRIITYHGISFSTGLNFMFTKSDPFIKNFIKENKKNYTPEGEFGRFAQLYNRFSKDQNGVKTIINLFQ